MSFPHVMSPLQASLSLLTIRFLHSPAFDLADIRRMACDFEPILPRLTVSG
jgi:hypothetical protein